MLILEEKNKMQLLLFSNKKHKKTSQVPNLDFVLSSNWLEFNLIFILISMYAESS